VARSLPRGIRPHRYGLLASVRIHQGPGGLKTKVFPPGTSLLIIRDWREAQRVTGKTTPRKQPQSGFAADAEVYLKAVKGMTSYSDRERDILSWVKVFGQTPRRQITAPAIAAQLAIWKLSASSLNHKRTALMHLWTVLDGKTAANPVRDVPKRREPEATARGLSYAVIEAILSDMADSATKARLRVIAYTGIPHASLARISRLDVSLDSKSVYVPGREKGKGTRGRRLPLTDAGVEAFRALIRWDAFGPFSHSSMYKSFKLARDRVGVDGCLKHVRPYDMRHSFGSALYAATGDIRATQILMGHSKPEMTHRYTLGAVDARVEAAIAAVSPSFQKSSGA
jgi:integrase